jgi:hypothetical protein
LGHKEGHAVVGVREIDGCLLESFGPSIHGVIMKGKNRKSMGRAKGL